MKMWKLALTVGSVLVSLSARANELSPIDKKLLGGSEILARKMAPLMMQGNSPGQNILYSSFNIMNALQLVYPGTSGAARGQVEAAIGLRGISQSDFYQSYAQVVQTITKPSEIEGATTFIIGTSLWANSIRGFQFSEDYLSNAKKYFGSEVEALDFQNQNAASLDKINASVSKATAGMIPRLLNSLEGSSEAVLIATLLIQGNWSNQFEMENTKEDADFTTVGTQVESVKKIPLMSRTANFLFAETERTQVVRMYTVDGKAALEITLPSQKSQTLTVRDEFLNRKLMLRQEDFDGKRVSLSVPRFRVDWSNEILNTIGTLVPGMLSEGGLDNLSKTPLVLTSVVHATALEVFEAGFKAAAATAMIFERSMAIETPVNMTVDRSFGVRLLAMVDGTEVEMFRGWIDDPQPLAKPKIEQPKP